MSSPISFSGCMKSSSSSIICEEVFDEGYQPSNDEINDYAIRIGINPKKEPYLLHIARDGLMQALPPNWQICYDDKYHVYYYLNRTTKITQWEHPLDSEFKRIADKIRHQHLNGSTGNDGFASNDDFSLIDSGIKSLQEKEDDEYNQLNENSQSMENFNNQNRLLASFSGNNRTNSTTKTTIGLGAPPSQIGLGIKTDENISKNLITFASNENSKPKGFTLTGTGSMFLKSNTNKTSLSFGNERVKDSFIGTGGNNDSSSLSSGVKGILRDSSLGDVRIKNNIFSQENSFDYEDRKSVRFNFDDKKDDDLEPDIVNADNNGEKEKSSEEKSSIDDEESDNEVEEEDDADEEDDDIQWNHLEKNSDEKNYITSIRVGLNPLKPITKLPSKQFTKNLSTFGKNENNENENLIKSITSSSSNVKPLYDNESYSDTEDSIKINQITTMKDKIKFEEKIEEEKLRNEMNQKLEKLKEELQEKNKIEILKFEENVLKTQNSKDELEKVLENKKETFSKELKENIEKLKANHVLEMKNIMKIYDERNENEKKQVEINQKKAIDDLKIKYHRILELMKNDLEINNRNEIEAYKIKMKYEYEEKRKEMGNEHRQTVEKLQKNHNEIMEELERDLKTEEELLKKDHLLNLSQMKDKLSHELEIERQRMRENGEDRLYEKVRCEKRLLEDKYRCLKEKYIRLKTDVKLSLERRNNRRKEQQQTSLTTGSETERSNSNHVNRNTPSSVPIDYGKPPLTPKLQQKIQQQPLPPPPSSTITKEPLKPFRNSASKYLKQLQSYNDDTTSISQSDTTVSNNYPKMRYITGNPLGDNGNSDSEAIRVARNFYNNNNNNNALNNNLNMKETTPARQRKKIFTRMKSASTSRLNSNSNNKRDQMMERPCTPVENLRRQLQKLEDLEDQFPDNSLDTTYHLRYPFTDIISNNHKGSSELEFFKHRIHLERDSVRRAKESLRTQRTNFRARQREIKQRHKCSTRHTIDQLIQEEKELTEMEVNLHRTRALLGEKVIRLRHLEQSLQRIYEKEKPIFMGGIADDSNRGTKEDATLSDLSSHSSSGFSSTDFQSDTNQLHNVNRHKENIYQESSEIIQSLENLNAEIREIWEILSKQQSHGLAPPPSFFYPEMNWSLTKPAPTVPVTTATIHSQPTVIPTLADRLETYRQLATGRATTTVSGIISPPNAANTIVSQSIAGHYTTSLVERTRDLRNWLRQAKNEHEMLGGNQQADL